MSDLSGDDRLMVVMAYLCLLSIPLLLVAIHGKLQRIIKLLERANELRRDKGCKSAE